MDSITMRLIAGVLAVLFGVLIFMRRRRNAD
jgi:LPXTG-motif cell wall-anchored protein